MKIVVDKMPTKPSECFFAHNRRINEESGHEYGICWIRGEGDWSSEVCALSYDRPCSYLTEQKEKPMPEQLRRLLLDLFHSTPTDAVPVIRCKDCVNSAAFPWRPEDCLWCPVNNRPVRVDDFCCEGSKKEEVEQ